jgi:ABC-type polysaccharide/polyol phosphate transport system ATPase subunit
MCHQVAWLDKGRLREVGDADTVTELYEKALVDEKE